MRTLLQRSWSRFMFDRWWLGMGCRPLLCMTEMCALLPGFGRDFMRSWVPGITLVPHTIHRRMVKVSGLFRHLRICGVHVSLFLVEFRTSIFRWVSFLITTSIMPILVCRHSRSYMVGDVGLLFVGAWWDRGSWGARR